MPNFFPPPPPPKLSRLALRLALACAILCTAADGTAQTLAHPGLVGNGLNADPWWQHAVFYKLAAPAPDAKALTAHLFALRSLGVDALLVPAPELSIPPAAAAEPSPDSQLEPFDEFLHEASRDGIRVLLTVPADTRVPDLAGLARFWLARGVAGFQIASAPGISPQATQTVVQAFRRATSSAVGQRIVLADFNPNAAVSVPAAQPAPVSTRRGGRRAALPANSGTPQLQIDTRLNALTLPEAANIRVLLAQSLGANLLLDFHPPTPPADAPDPFPALARPLAAILLAAHPAALLEADRMPALPAPPAPEPATPPPAPPPPDPTRTFTIVTAQTHPVAVAPAAPDPLLDWYRELATLHHDNPALRYGALQLLNFDDQNALAWVARPATNSPLTAPVLVACNLSATPVQLALGAALKSLDLRGNYLRTLLRSDKSMGPQDLNSVILPPFGVYIGELHR